MFEYNNLSKSFETLSSGRFSVYKSVLPNGDWVAVKVSGNDLGKESLFCEFEGLKFLEQLNKVPVAKPLFLGEENGLHYLVTQFIKQGRTNELTFEQFGRSLAELHKVSNSYFGFEYDNYFGLCTQYNRQTTDIYDFWVNNRILPYAKLCFDTHMLDVATYRKIELYCKALPQLIPPLRPSALHGDLWGGNSIVNPEGQIVLIDPATNFGISEFEVAFTTLFGRLSPSFYSAYFEVNPSPPNFEQRIGYYNLFPLLVHLYLFGTGYLPQVKQVVARF